MDSEPTFDLDAAGLRADGADLVVGVEVLAAKLEDALPAATTVQRRAKGLFGRGKKHVRSVEVRLGEVRYALAVDGQAVTADRCREVRGVVIKREPLELAAWVAGLGDELRAQAADSEQARRALERLVG